MAGTRSAATNINDSNLQVQHLQLPIGSKLFPEYPLRSQPECFYNLRQSLGMQGNHLHALDIKDHEYRNNKIIVGFDIGQMLGLAWQELTQQIV